MRVIQTVSLEEVLINREKRISVQKKLLNIYPGTLICFLLNIPGTEKVNQVYENVFYKGMERIQEQLEKKKILIEVQLIQRKTTGYEGYLVVNGQCRQIKELMVELEETPIGRLYDIDVLTDANQKISRSDLGLSPRRCLICGRPAHECGRSRKHSVIELKEKIYNLVWEEQLYKLVKEEIRQALFDEICTTPKPGLVDREDCGAHRDMNYKLFCKSIEAITGDLGEMFSIGYKWEGDLNGLFVRIKELGKRTEEKMYIATKGINTHKGSIFTIGILASAAGYSMRIFGNITAEGVCKISQKMTENILQEELEEMKKHLPVSHGEQVYCKYGEKGIRGLAMDGYPLLWKTTVPHMREYTEENKSKNLICVHILLEIISELTDTNVLSRTSREELWWLQKEAKEILEKGGAFRKNALEEVRKLNNKCIRKNISPGGAADLLAATIFLFRMEKLSNYIYNFKSKEEMILEVSIEYYTM